MTLPRSAVAPTTNAQSCVLRVVTQGQALLIPADTGKEEETALLQQYGEQLHSTVLLLCRSMAAYSVISVSFGGLPA